MDDVGVVPWKRGRKKVYSLTEQGRDGAIRACEYFCRSYGEIFEEFGSPVSQPGSGLNVSPEPILTLNPHFQVFKCFI